MTQKHHQYTQQLRLEAYISLKTIDHIMRLIFIYHSHISTHISLTQHTGITANSRLFYKLLITAVHIGSS